MDETKAEINNVLYQRTPVAEFLLVALFPDAFQFS
jgi:hypothetical protein